MTAKVKHAKCITEEELQKILEKKLTEEEVRAIYTKLESGCTECRRICKAFWDKQKKPASRK